MTPNAKPTAKELRPVVKTPARNACDQDGAELLAALDEAVQRKY